MPASIFGSRFAGHREPAWHGLGTVFEDAITVSDAISLAGMDYEVVKVPIIAQAFGQQVDSGKVQLVREPTSDDPTPRHFGIVGPNYSVIQNRDLGKMLDPLSKKWPTETVGALGNGESVFFTLDAGEGEVAGESIKKYFLVTDAKDGGETLRIAYTPVRVVCQNTLILGLSAASSMIALRHYEDLPEDLEFHLSLIERMQIMEDQVQVQLEFLATKNVVMEQVEEILTKTYPMPSRPARIEILGDSQSLDGLGVSMTSSLLQRYQTAKDVYERSIERTQALREGATELYDKMNDEYPNVAQTGWAIYNAIVETEDYRRGGNAKVSSLFGARAATKARAFKATVSV